MPVIAPSKLQIAGTASVPIVGSLLNGYYNASLYRLHPGLFWLADFILFAALPMAIAYWLAKSANIRPRNYGLQFPPFGGIEPLASSLFLGTLLFATHFVAQYLGWVFTWQWYTEPDFSYGTALPKGPLHLPALLYMSLSAGLMESVFYLALPWYFWRNYLGLAHRRRTFVWLSSAVFASVHWEQGPHNMVAVFAFGFVACLLYWKINDLWPIVGAHTVVDIALLS